MYCLIYNPLPEMTLHIQSKLFRIWFCEVHPKISHCHGAEDERPDCAQRDHLHLELGVRPERTWIKLRRSRSANRMLRTPTAFGIASPSHREVAQGDPGCVMKKSLSEASGTILCDKNCKEIF